jgi:hypothetical protein
MIILRTPAMGRWTVSVSAQYATFTGAPLVEDHTAAQALPRVWAGRGLGVHEDELAGFTSGLAEVMKTPPYWSAQARRRGEAANREHTEPWSVPRRDDDDGFVYTTGPTGRPGGDAGYRPATVFSLALTDVRSLRIRLAAYLKDRQQPLRTTC